MKESAGTLLYRQHEGALEILLLYPDQQLLLEWLVRREAEDRAQKP